MGKPKWTAVKKAGLLFMRGTTERIVSELIPRRRQIARALPQIRVLRQLRLGSPNRECSPTTRLVSSLCNGLLENRRLTSIDIWIRIAGAESDKLCETSEFVSYRNLCDQLLCCADSSNKNRSLWPHVFAKITKHRCPSAIFHVLRRIPDQVLGTTEDSHKRKAA